MLDIVLINNLRKC